MNRALYVITALAALALSVVACSVGSALAAPAPNCAAFNIDPAASRPLASVAADHAPGSCHIRLAANGMQLPDPACTPGAINPTVTAEVLKNPAFRTACVRGAGVSESQSDIVYAWYGIPKPAHDKGPGQTCEKDHLDSLLAGGADVLSNIWPQCSPASIPIGRREFKIKDAHAEMPIRAMVKAGAGLPTIQRRIAEDWTQFITAP